MLPRKEQLLELKSVSVFLTRELIVFQRRLYKAMNELICSFLAFQFCVVYFDTYGSAGAFLPYLQSHEFG